MWIIQMHHLIKEPGMVEKVLSWKLTNPEAWILSVALARAASIAAVDKSHDLFWSQDFHLRKEISNM